VIGAAVEVAKITRARDHLVFPPCQIQAKIGIMHRIKTLGKLRAALAGLAEAGRVVLETASLVQHCDSAGQCPGKAETEAA
jgi:hypothetical protein